MNVYTLQCMSPEGVLFATAFVLLLGDIMGKLKKRAGFIVFVMGMVLALGALFSCAPMVHAGGGSLLGGRFVIDGVAFWMKLLFIVGAAITAALSEISPHEVTSENRNEYYIVLAFTVIGACFLASARDMVTLYVSLELAGIPLYLLAAWRRDSGSTEAGLKYLVLGSIASAFLLYGLSVLYGLSGTMNLAEVGQHLSQGPVLWLAAGAVIAGAGLKLSAAPFHFWTPDVYQGAPTPVTAYLSVVSKAVSLSLLFALVYLVLGKFVGSWAVPFAILAAVTMTWGNIAAVTTNDVKRLLAFSGISQAGYLLLGFIGTSEDNLPAIIYYMLVYLLTNLAVFGVLAAFSGERRCEKIADFRGLSRDNPTLALSMTLALFSLSGIPPLSGFVGKFFLFSIASQNGMHWLVALAALNSTVSLYYYLRIVREMYIEPSPAGSADGQKAVITVHPILKASLALTVASVVVLGVVPIFYHAIFDDTAHVLNTPSFSTARPPNSAQPMGVLLK